MMKKFYAGLLLSCLSLVGYAQSAASYGFTATTGTFNTISSTGTATTAISGDDNTLTGISIGFTFNFCGTNYTQVSVCSNGWLSLANSSDVGYHNTNTTVAYTYYPTPGNGLLMPFWDDLYGGPLPISHTAYYQTSGTAPYRTFTFEWSNWGVFIYNTYYANLQVILYETTNQIDYVYGTSSSGTGSYGTRSATIGLANSTSDYSVLNNGSSSPTPSTSTFTTSISALPANGQVYRWNPPPAACSGTPTAGSAVAVPSSACGSSTISLSLTGYTIVSGVTYQWQKSSDGISWSNISGATNLYLTTTESSALYYRCNITCTASSSTAASTSILVPYTSGCYCIPSYSRAFASCDSLFISMTGFHVTGTASTAINDVAHCTGTGYFDRTALSVSLFDGTTYTATINGNASTGMNAQAWIDFNDDFTFQTSESVGGLNNYFTTGTFSLAIPSGSSLGTHRMRVVTADNASGHAYSSMDPCTSGYALGDARDYNVIIYPTCSGTPTGGTTATSASPVCTAVPFTVSVSGYTVAGGITFQWQSSPDNSTWTPIGGATTTSYTTSESSATYFRCVVTCGTSSVSTPSASILVNYLSTCYCTPSYSAAAAACTSGAAISSLQIAGASSTLLNDVLACNSSGYQIRTALSVSLLQGSSYTAYIAGGAINQNVQTWIDFDNDGTFASSESVGGLNGFTTSGSYAVNISSGANIGTHRMRVVTSRAIDGFTYPSMNPCTPSYVRGEARDYTVNILPNSCTGTPTAGTLSVSIASGCSAFTTTLSAVGYTAAPFTYYRWQSSTDSTTWTGVSGAFSSTYTTTVSSGAIYYRFLDSCSSSGLVGYSAGVRLVVNTVPVASAITGTTTIIIGNTSALSDATTGGTWTTSSASIASVNSSGVVTSVAVGTATITYTVTNVCGTDFATASVNVIPPCNIITTLAGTGTGGYTGDGGAATAARILGAYAVAMDASGNTYIAEEGNSIIRKVSTTGTISTYAGTGTAGYSGDGGAATAANLQNPSGVAVDAAGNVYIVDRGNIRVRKVNTSGTITTIAGTGSAGYSGDGGAATAAQLNNVFGVAIDASGNVYLSDAGNARIRKINTSGTISTIAGNGSVGYSGDGSAATAAQLNTPYGVAVDALGNIFIADFGNNRIRIVNTTGTISTYAGNGTAGSTGDGGAATAAQINQVIGIALDNYSNLYLVDLAANVMRKVNNAGIITAVAGTGAAAYGGDGGNATAASLQNPYGVCADANGNVLIADTYNNRVRKIATGNPAIAAITGISTVCETANINLTDGSAGGTWSAANGNATVLGGLVTGITPGIDTIYYTVSNGCGTERVSKVVTINPLPHAGTLSGPVSVCESSSITLTSSGSAGGSWSAANAHATVAAGVVSGATGGVDTIYYTVTNSCGTNVAPYVVNVTALPHAGTLSGPATVCEAAFITLSSTTGGGTWSSTTGNASVIPATGLVNGITAGADTMVYTVTNGCATDVAYYPITVNPLPHAGTISGPASVCETASITLSSTVSGGTWSMTNTNATISTTTVTGITAGMDTVKYTFTNSCGVDVSTYPITVNPAPVAGIISGAATVCEAAATTLTESVTGGTWSAANGNATVTGGIVNGITAGVDTIMYSVTNGCGTAVVAHSITINPLPNPGTITGSATSVCVSATISFSTSGSGGTWHSSTGHISVSSAGVVTGMAAGTTILSYTVSNSCGTRSDTVLITVTPTPSAGFISGVSSVCEAATITLTESATGGTWSASNSHATVTGGTVAGITAGIDTIYYTVTNACGTAVANRTMTINPLPYAGTITASVTSVCVSSSISYADATAGGTWSSGSSTIANVGSTGSVTGMSAGTTFISYTVTNVCGSASTAMGVTVNPLPVGGTISGPSSVCLGSAITLTDATGSAGGSWTSSTPSIASVDATGNVFGSATGTAIITYMVTTATCGSAFATATITVNPIPYAGVISGPTSVCRGSTISLTDIGGSTGGSWTSSASGTASVVAGTGVVTGVTAGTAIITYSATTATCGTARATTTITVMPLPVAGTITGPAVVCEASSITLADATGTSGGNWTSANPAIATINTSGVLTGIAAGAVNISYTAVTASCGTATTTFTVTVNPLPHAGTITGVTNLCPATSTTLADAVTGGTWISTNVHTTHTGGIIAGVTPGIDTIGYSVTNSCGTDISRVVVTVYPVPVAGTITGPSSVCVGSTITLTDATGTPGGVWTSSNISRATIDASSALATGIAAGTVMISYTITNICGTAVVASSLTVNPVVTPSISTTATPGLSVCEGDPIFFTAVPVNGGTAPIFTWRLGTVFMGSGATFSYVPANGDIIHCDLLSNAACLSVSTATTSSYITVSPIITPTMVITAVPNDTAVYGQLVSFTSTVTGGGSVPTYQWYVNGGMIAGATNATYSQNFFTSSIVHCELTSNSPCISAPLVLSNFVSIYVFGLNVSSVKGGISGLSLYPNPNTGSFTLNAQANEAITFEVLDMPGKVVYKGTAIPQQGTVKQQIILGDNIASGQYILKVVSQNGTEYVHFTKE